LKPESKAHTEYFCADNKLLKAITEVIIKVQKVRNYQEVF